MVLIRLDSPLQSWTARMEEKPNREIAEKGGKGGELMMSDDSRREIIPRARPRHRDSAFIMGISLITSNPPP